MNDNQINVAIAKACGWTPHSVESFGSMWFRPGEKHRLLERTMRIPVYTTDLNAMRTALATVTYEEHPFLIAALKKVLMKDEGVSEWDLLNSSSQEQAKAFLMLVQHCRRQ